VVGGEALGDHVEVVVVVQRGVKHQHRRAVAASLEEDASGLGPHLWHLVLSPSRDRMTDRSVTDDSRSAALGDRAVTQEE
jgi:hypothetical protein